MQRPADMVARYGGEEFVVLLPDTDMNGAVRFGDALRAAVESLAIEHSGNDGVNIVSISVGVSSVIPTQVLDNNALLGAADRALYLSSGTGRNRVSSQAVPAAIDTIE
jgi:diguanylate cyclase (GGDEF)-like protein